MTLPRASLSIPVDPGGADVANGCSEILTNVMRDAVQQKKGMLVDET